MFDEDEAWTLFYQHLLLSTTFAIEAPIQVHELSPLITSTQSFDGLDNWGTSVPIFSPRQTSPACLLWSRDREAKLQTNHLPSAVPELRTWQLSVYNLGFKIDTQHTMDSQAGRTFHKNSDSIYSICFIVYNNGDNIIFDK